MGVFRSLSGVVVAELTSADIAGTLTAISARGILVLRAQISGDLSARIQVFRRDFRKIRQTVSRKGGSVRIAGRRGLYWTLKGLLSRPVLTAGSLMLLCLALYLPGRVLFVEVEGNNAVPSNLILEAAAQSGIRFGTSRRTVRSEKVKNALLSAVPQLQWAGVNTRGCVAVVSVRERAPEPAEETLPPVCSIVADRDGIVLSVTVTDGNGLCTVGQAVREGEVLISAFTDCGLCTTATRARGEILASTQRQITVKTPAERLLRGESAGSSKEFSLIVGKKRINFYKDSGISDASCVKMYTEYCLTLPGGFQLPVKLVKETHTAFAADADAVTEDMIESRLQACAQVYLCGQMVAGRILDGTGYLVSENGAWCLTGTYACTEMIGRVQTEQIGEIP